MVGRTEAVRFGSESARLPFGSASVRSYSAIPQILRVASPIR
jgi:hypothetical protein